MNRGIYSGVSSGRASERRLEAITANLANLDTPAYKRVSTGMKAFRVPGGSMDEHEIVTHSERDFSQGNLEQSANPYDLALMGPGFFTVDGPKGELYTRNGSFRVNQDGVLLTDEGYPVTWEDTPTPIDPTGDLITVDASGQMRQGEAAIGRLKLVDFAAPSKLVSNGGGYFEAARGNPERPSNAVVHQHHTERSNVSSIDELVALISVQRSFEAAKNVMSLLDQSYARLTSPR